MTIVVTRNVPDRYRGFLASVMLEVAPGIYVSPGMSRGVRERVWTVCCDWASLLPTDGSVTVMWRDASFPGGLAMEVLGAPKAALVDHDGIWLDLHDLTVTQEALLRHPAGSEQSLTTE